MEEVAQVRVAMFGGSYYLNLPSTLVKVMGLEKGKVMRVYRDGNKIIFEEGKPTWPVVKPK
jgi:antitoxin component of MazEF toxin-antitoxin module